MLINSIKTSVNAVLFNNGLPSCDDDTALFIDHPQAAMRYYFGRVCTYVCRPISVSLYVCQTINFKRVDVGSSFSHMRYISREYGSNSYMKVIGSRSRSQERKKGRKFLLPQCKTSIGNNARSIKHRAVRDVCMQHVAFG